MPAIVEYPTVVNDILDEFAPLFANEPERRHFGSIGPFETARASFSYSLRKSPIGEIRKDAMGLGLDRRLKLGLPFPPESAGSKDGDGDPLDRWVRQLCNEVTRYHRRR